VLLSTGRLSTKPCHRCGDGQDLAAAGLAFLRQRSLRHLQAARSDLFVRAGGGQFGPGRGHLGARLVELRCRHHALFAQLLQPAQLALRHRFGGRDSGHTLARRVEGALAGADLRKRLAA
jgi:hypothetical protein